MECKDYLMKFDEILCTMSNKMLKNYSQNDITTYFIKCMVPHHQAAIYMCENLLKYTDYEPLQKIARNIIKTQMAGIKEMLDICETTIGYYNIKKDVNCYVSKYLMITNDMILRMKNSPRCRYINLNFVNEMIPHHEGAILMCKNLLKYNIDPRLENVAKSIIEEQSKGVKELKEIYMNFCT